MSQQSQAENLQQRGVQNWSEVQQDVVALQAKHAAGEISGEAVDAAIKELDDRADVVQIEIDRATALNTLSGRAAGFSAAARQPAYSRPLAEVEPEQLATQDALSRPAQPDPAEIQHTEGPVTGLARDLLNQYLRPEKRGGGRAALTDAGWQYLTRGAPVPNAERLSQYLAASRGESLALTPYVDSSGGYVMAEQIHNEVVSIRSRATSIPARVRSIPGVVTRLTIPTSKITIAFTIGSKKTGQSITPVDISEVFGKSALTPHRSDAILKIPEEFFENPAFDAVGEIARNAERSDREDLETDILHGNGSGKILGIVTALKALYAAGGTNVGIDIAGSGAAVVPEDVQTFDLELHQGARQNGVWIFNRPGLKKVRLFRTNEGGDSTGEFLFKRAMEAGQPDSLNGKEILETEFLEDKVTSGVAGDVLWLFGDPDDFWLITAKDLQLKILEELYTEENMIGYKWTSARDGALVRGDAWIYQRRTA